jgi:hypothetical protein
VVVPAGAAAATSTIVMPSLLLTVKVAGVNTNSVPVKITDQECTIGTTNVSRTTSTSTVTVGTVATNGLLANPELPWGKYKVCAWTTISTKKRREESAVIDLTSATGAPQAKTLTIDLTTADPEGECP